MAEACIEQPWLGGGKLRTKEDNIRAIANGYLGPRPEGFIKEILARPIEDEESYYGGRINPWPLRARPTTESRTASPSRGTITCDRPALSTADALAAASIHSSSHLRRLTAAHAPPSAIELAAHEQRL